MLDAREMCCREETLEYTLLKQGAECRSHDKDLGHKDTLEQCAQAAKLEGATYFIYGYGLIKNHKCYVEYTDHESCEEGWQHDDYNFYSLTTPTHYNIVQKGAECRSRDKDLGHKDTLKKCAEAAQRAGGQYFIYGHGLVKNHACFVEFTKDETCEEGWERDDFDFYTLIPEPLDYTMVQSNAECKSRGADLGKKDSVEDCAQAVKLEGGRFFIYGYGMFKDKNCWMESTQSASCPEGFERDDYNFYELINHDAAEYTMVQSNAECKSKGADLGKKDTVTQCAQAVRLMGGRFFIYGHGFFKDKHCWMESTQSASCPEGWQRDDYNFYEVTNNAEAQYNLVKSNAECKSRGADLGKKDTVTQCAETVRLEGGRFFIYGHGLFKDKNCWMESTQSASCPEGWQKDDYNFYELINHYSAEYSLVKENVECRSKGTDLGKKDTVTQCAYAARSLGGRFFIYGHGLFKDKNCWIEGTHSASCPEGWQNDDYNFYELPSNTAAAQMVTEAKPWEMDTAEYLVYGFALVGVTAVAYTLLRTQTKRTEFTPIQQLTEDEEL